MADPILILQHTGADCVLYDFNAAAALATAGDVRRVLGQPLHVLCDRQPELVAGVQECFASAATCVREVAYAPPAAASPRTFRVTVVTLAPTTVVLIGNDITELKQLQAQFGQRPGA